MEESAVGLTPRLYFTARACTIARATREREDANVNTAISVEQGIVIPPEVTKDKSLPGLAWQHLLRK